MNVGDTFGLPAGVRWLDRPPLRFDVALQGHVVVVVAWRLGCVHSRDAVVEVARLVDEFAGRPVALLAVHSPVTAAEREEPRLQRTVQLLDLAAAVVVDAARALLAGAAVADLPALWLVDADGVVRVRGTGVPFRQRLRDAVEVLLDEAAHLGRLARVPFVPCAPRRVLRLGPTALLTRAGRIWLAAAAARRVAELDADGRLVRTIGSGLAGADDGVPAKARWRWPSAFVAAEAGVFVLDAAAHTVRCIDGGGDVMTWWGNGRRSTDRVGGAYGTDQALATPTAACTHEGSLLVALAGVHQLWQFDPGTRAALAWLGGGERGGEDGTRPTFREPAALLVHGDTLWVAEAAGGALRLIDLAHLTTRTVHTGLPRPVALAWHGEALLVAVADGAAVLRCASGEGVPEPLFTAAHGLVEPVALALDGDRLLIADLGADRVFAADLAAPTPTLLPLPAVDLPPAPTTVPAPGTVLLAPVRLAAANDVTVRVPLPLPAERNFELVDLGDLTIDVVDEAEPVLAAPRHTAVPADDGHVAVLLPIAAAGDGALRFTIRGERRVGGFVRELVWRYLLPVTAADDGAVDVRLV